MLDAINIEANERLGRYEVLSEVGRGAMGVVYLARDPLIGRQVALKVFRVGFSASEDELRNLYARFIREAQSAGILSHPNIVTVHDVTQADGDSPAFIAMEYVEGETLKQILDVPGLIPRARAIDLVSQVATALDYAHSMGVVHRDVKPGNVLVAANDHVKITDFGIALVNAANITNYGQLLGTPSYMAPEILQEKEVDHRADLFSLGVVLYELLTRNKPFVGSSLTKVSHCIVQDPFTPPGEHGVDLPPALEACVARALEKDPSERFQTASQFVRALDKARKEQDELDEEAQSGIGLSPFEAEAVDEWVPMVDADPGSGPMDSGPLVGAGAVSAEALSVEEMSLDGESVAPGTGEVTGEVPGEVAGDHRDAADSSAPMAPAAARARRRAAQSTAEKAVSKGRRKLPWLLAVGIVSGVALGYLLSRSPAPTPAPAAPAAAEVDVLEPLEDRVRNLLALAAAHSSVGDDEGARAALAEAARILPDDGMIRAELVATESRLRSSHAEWQSQIEDHLAAANRSLESERYRDAAHYANQALDLDPMNLEAAHIVTSAQREESLEAARAEEAEAQVPVEVEERPSPVVPEPQAEVEPAEIVEPEPAAPVPTTATLSIELEAALSPGVITLYEGGSQIFRERFRFTKEKKGFIGSIRSKAKASGGSLSRELEYEAGDLDLRLYVALPGSPTQVLPLRGDLFAGERHVLSIVIDEDGQARADLD